MALQVKKSILQREKTILVAIDMALRKMEMLSMISTLCHQFSTPRSSRNCLLETLSTALGKEAVDILEQLVLCQKSYNELLGEGGTVPMRSPQAPVSTKTVISKTELKNDLIHRLKESPEKRKFLKEVLEKGKTLVNRTNETTCRGSITDQNTIGRSMQTSVVGLLRAALESKYKQHVVRCFKDLDVESLISILYLIMPSSSPPSEHLVASKFMNDDSDISSFSSIMEKHVALMEKHESNNYKESPLTSADSLHSIFWDDEVSVINFVEEIEKDDENHLEAEQKWTEMGLWKQRSDTDIMKLAVELQEKFRNVMMPQCPLSIANIIDTFPVHGLVNEVRQNYFYELEAVDTYEKFANLMSTLDVETICRVLTSECMDGDDKKMLNLIQVLRLFRSLVESMFARGERKQHGHGLHRSFDKMTIELKLLSIQEDKFKGKLNKMIESHRSQQEQLNGSVTEWRDQVGDMRRQMSQQIRNSIKDHVAVEISIGKSWEKELATHKQELAKRKGSLFQTEHFVRQAVKSLRARRHYLEASLESIIREYNSTMLKYQAKIDELSVEEKAYNREVEGLQNKFKDIEEKYDEMRAMKRLKQLLQNMQKAEAIKQNWAARKIQVAWRKYKVAKLRKKKLKGRKKGKKKTPPPGKGTSPPTKSSTPGSRSKSQTP